MLRCLGLDAGVNHTGWAIIEGDGQKLRSICNGTIRPKTGLPLSARLLTIFEGIQHVIKHYSPACAAVEETFVNRNGKTTLILGQARGVALMAPASLGVPVAEYATNKIKKAVVGHGHADKTQVQAMLNLLMPTITLHSADAADACAVAVCHVHHHFSQQQWSHA